MPEKKTKIVATIGPGSESPETLSELIKAGLNVARCNMSHGDHAEHGARIAAIRAAAQKENTPVAVLVDLSGPKIRTGEYTTERITIEQGAMVTITTDEIVGDPSRFSINYANLPKEVSEGSVIMLDDGKKKLTVDRVEGNDIICTVAVGGELKSRRGVNIPGAYLSISSITEKDRKDLAFALEQHADYIALSFVRRAEDVLELKELMKEAGKNVPVIAKIETQEAIDNLSDIMNAADGVMVARGDLAIEVPTEMVPLLQKRIIKAANALGKPVITATQMLESMIHNPVPTRAEVSDIANAIIDGTDGVMLSEESALGKYPAEAVSMMARIAHIVEASHERDEGVNMSITDSISASVVRTAEHVDAKCIVALTETGGTARMIARWKPLADIVALSPHAETVERLALVRGVTPFQIDEAKTIEDTYSFIPEFLREHGLAEKGDRVVVAAGLNSGVSGATNLLFVVTL